MKLSEIVEPYAVVVPFEANGKWEAIERLAERLIAVGKVEAKMAADLKAALFARERSMSTGMVDGVAIPHAAIDGIDRVSAAMGLSPSGVPFEAVDGKPAQIIVCLVIPRQQKLLHIRTLAEIARLLSKDAIRKRLLGCPDAIAVVEAIKDEERNVGGLPAR